MCNEDNDDGDNKIIKIINLNKSESENLSIEIQ
jgi:hypothetical protein